MHSLHDQLFKELADAITSSRELRRLAERLVRVDSAEELGLA